MLYFVINTSIPKTGIFQESVRKARCWKRQQWLPFGGGGAVSSEAQVPRQEERSKNWIKAVLAKDGEGKASGL